MFRYADFFVGVRLAARARFLWLAAGFIFVLMLSALLAAQFSGRQPATVALDVGLSVMRLLLPVLIVLMAQELLSKEFDRRYYLNSLAYPLPRYRLFVSRFIVVVFLVGCLLVVMSLLLSLLVKYIGEGYQQATPVALGFPFWVTISFVGVDLLVLAALACFLAVVASTPSFVLVGTLGFMLVARSFSDIVELLGRNTLLVSDSEGYQRGVSALSYFFPDLGALDVRMIALYDSMRFLPDGYVFILISSFAYVFAILFVAIWFLQRKRFA